MSSTRLELKRPPVNEVLIGIHFEPIQELGVRSMVAFWEKVFPSYSGAFASRVPPENMTYDRPPFAHPQAAHQLSLTSDPSEQRLQLRSNDKAEMIQLQSDWFFTNWMRRKRPEYIGFTQVKENHDRNWASFHEFLADRGLSTPQIKAWEVTYVDLIPSGTVWNSPGEMSKVLPGILGEYHSDRGPIEGMDYAMSASVDSRSRLTMRVETFASAPEPVAVNRLKVTFTCRGALRESGFDSIDDALFFGRDVCNEAFFKVVSDDAVKYWKEDS